MTPYDRKTKDTVYRLIDPYVYFYLSWIEPAPDGVFSGNGTKYWLDKSRTPAYLAWAGYTFENLCLTHSRCIQKALRLEHIGCQVGTWSYSPPRRDKVRSGAQIDLLFDREDGIVSLCEIKFCTQVFSIDKAYARELKSKLDVFQAVTKTRKDVQMVLITLEGLKPNAWSDDLITEVLDVKTIFGS